VDSARLTCLCQPIPEIERAARLLDEATTAHLNQDFDRAASLISEADMPKIRQWTEDLWGSSKYVQPRRVLNAPPHLAKGDRIPVRMPSAVERARLHSRDGFHYRFCGLPLIRKEIRERIRKCYRHLPIWGRQNSEQHAALQAMWLQYDHVLPHSRGGDNSFENMIITCAPCNYARMQYTLEELGLVDPRVRETVRSSWDGLERFR
jgi:5-methylcytosine-specific restriction endonuclease McrA